MPALGDALLVVRGAGDVASAIAHRWFALGRPVLILCEARPSLPRRAMAFVDAVFDGAAVLEGVRAQRVATLAQARALLAERAAIPLWPAPPLELAALCAALAPAVLVDARLRKRDAPEPLRGLAPLTVALGPGFVAGHHADLAVETGWEGLGRVLTSGVTQALKGAPRAIEGLARERVVYASGAGELRALRRLGELVSAGETVATLNGDAVAAPVAGLLRGLTRDGVRVAAGTKIVEIDPRGERGVWAGIGERPRALAAAVTRAAEERLAQRPLTP
jgi:xanthine dehydrogenase accessory factor